MNSGTETQNCGKPSVGNWLVMKSSRAGSGYGSGLSSTPLMTLKIALLAPMPSASVRMVTAA